MGRKAFLSGVQAKGPDRIQFDFEFEGGRYRPTLTRIPSETNLRRAHKQLIDIKKRIERGMFNFQEEFPGYRYKASLAVTDEVIARPETCNDVFDKFPAYKEHRVSMDDTALSTLNGYRESIRLRSTRPSRSSPPLIECMASGMATTKSFASSRAFDSPSISRWRSRIAI